MKIGIVTIVDYTNYGNRLQNYALYYILRKKMGCKAISLVSYEEKPFYNGEYVVWLKNQVIKTLCCFPKYAEKRFGSNVIRWANFHKWSKLIPTKNYYECKMLPKSLNDEYDFFFSGSDQVWNYHISSNRFDDFFLRFTDDEKKVAISTSFGVDDIPEEWKQTYIDGLSAFAHISVREDAGQNIIKKLLGKDVPVLLDPTMVLSKKEWLNVAKSPRVDCSKPYVLKYYLGDEEEGEKIDSWAKNNGYEVLELMNEKIPELYSAGPGEFISLISNASLVCSDSFHCIVFSIIFSIPFIVFARRGKENYMSSRLDTLLAKFGFQNRWKHLVSENDYLNCDFSDVNDLLEKERRQFMEYIKNAIKST